MLATLVSAGPLLVNGSLGASAVTGENGATFGGSGSIGSTLALGATSSFQVADLSDALGVSGAITFGSGFGIANLLGIDWDSVALDTSHTVVSTSQTFGTSAIANFGFDNRVAVGSLGREGVFEAVDHHGMDGHLARLKFLLGGAQAAPRHGTARPCSPSPI